MNENQFQRRVARLNSAVLYLCYSQSIKLKDVNPTHTLENINLLLNTTLCDLGRIGFVDPSNIDSQNLNDLMTEQNSDSEDENNLPQEWETIQHVMDMPSPSSMLQQQPAVNQSSMAGQMLQTAQSSIASFWKGWTK